MTSRPSSVPRSSATDRLPRLARAIDRFTPPLSVPIPCVARLRYGSPSGRSTLITSAPQSASSAPATGTKTHWASSTTRMPSKGSATARLHQPATVDLGRRAPGHLVDQLHGLGDLVGG